jgi:CheY-like chemotaxis protein
VCRVNDESCWGRSLERVFCRTPETSSQHVRGSQSVAMNAGMGRQIPSRFEREGGIALAPVLVVDSDPELLASYERLLQRFGCRVFSARSRREALRYLSCERVRLVVVDVRLSDGDGLDVVRIARGTRMPPVVIIVTGSPADGTGRQAFEAGATAYVSKPIGLHAFAVLLEGLLRACVADRR